MKVTFDIFNMQKLSCEKCGKVIGIIEYDADYYFDLSLCGKCSKDKLVKKTVKILRGKE